MLSNNALHLILNLVHNKAISNLAVTLTAAVVMTLITLTVVIVTTGSTQQFLQHALPSSAVHTVLWLVIPIVAADIFHLLAPSVFAARCVRHSRSPHTRCCCTLSGPQQTKQQRVQTGVVLTACGCLALLLKSSCVLL